MTKQAVVLPILVLLALASCTGGPDDSAAQMQATIDDLVLEDTNSPTDEWKAANDLVWSAESPSEIRVIVQNFHHEGSTQQSEAVYVPEGEHYKVGDLLYFSIRRRLWDRQSYENSKLSFMQTKEALAEWAAEQG